jgi:hypothetical protein
MISYKKYIYVRQYFISFNKIMPCLIKVIVKCINDYHTNLLFRVAMHSVAMVTNISDQVLYIATLQLYELCISMHITLVQLSFNKIAIIR